MHDRTERLSRQARAQFAVTGLCLLTTAATLAAVYWHALYEAADPAAGRLAAALSVAVLIGLPLNGALFLADYLWCQIAELASLRGLAAEVADPTVLYRLYDDSGVLLYVGITRDLDRRMRQHEQKQPWWSAVAKTETITYHTRAQAARAEHAAIMGEDPRHNTARLERNAHLRSALTR